VLEHLVGNHGGGAAGAIVGGKLGEAMTSLFGHGNQRVAEAIEGIRRQALTDPVFARNLLVKYHPGMPSSAGQRALAYVTSRVPGFAGAIASTPSDQKGPPLLRPYSGSVTEMFRVPQNAGSPAD
jgi:hypothetical protein